MSAHRLNGPMLARLRQCAADTSPNWDGKITIYPPEARDLVAFIDSAIGEQKGNTEVAREVWVDTTCAACGRRVRAWCTDALGRAKVILDPESTDDGDTIIQADGTPQGVIREDVVGRYELYRAHFFTCPAHLEVPKRHADG